MAAKLPWFKWFADDWLSDEKLRACSPGARGLWCDMLSLMHKCDRRGYLLVNGKPPTAEQLARMTSCTAEEVSRFQAELVSAGVPSVTVDGTLYSRKMVRDQEKSEKCAEAGRKGGGSPKLQSGTIDTYKGPAKGASKGESKGGLKHPSGSGVCLGEEGSSSSNPDTHSTGVGGPGGGATYKGPAKGASKGRAADGLDRDFDRFWRAYPRREAKMEARIAWDQLAPDAGLVEIILAALERHKASPQWQRGVIPHPATWLKGCRWQDESEPRDATAAAGSSSRRTQEEVERVFRERGLCPTSPPAGANGSNTTAPSSDSSPPTS